MVISAGNWEQTFREWSKPSSETEAAKSERAERMIREAIREHGWFAGMQPNVYAKGSYKNNTNVRLDSDVDVVIEFTRCFYYDNSAVPVFSPGLAGFFTPSQYTFQEFKGQVNEALINKFGLWAVTRGNKAFDIHENTARVDADAVACWEYRHYYGQGASEFHKGTKFLADDGTVVINWPEQQRANGNAKNLRTGGRFKLVTRIVKRLRNEMAQAGYKVAEPIASYFIECLMYNVPDNFFGYPSYTYDVRLALAHVIADSQPDSAWVEVNQMKYLYGGCQSWTRQQATDFALAAYGYCGFGGS